MDSRYVEWLKKQGVKLFEGGGIYWRLYQGALVPAPATTCYVELTKDEASTLLKESGAMLLRYSCKPYAEKTEWWNIVCDKYNFQDLSSNTRSKINRGNKRCFIKIIDPEWMAYNGYECYVSAFDRYRNMMPINKVKFRDSILTTIEGPFEYWCVFVDKKLAGYCQCIVENSEIATNVFKYDPVFLKYYTSYALINSLLTHYVIERNMIISNGARSISHETNMQDFLLKFGFRRQYCHLNILYQPSLKIMIQVLFPFRKLIYRLPIRGNMHKLQSLMFQEELSRIL